jgi:hypothetical protein
MKSVPVLANQPIAITTLPCLLNPASSPAASSVDGA